jgi:hypothetical protein
MVGGDEAVGHGTKNRRTPTGWRMEMDEGKWARMFEEWLDGKGSENTLGFTPFGGQIIKENSDGRPRIGSVTDSPRSSAV